MREYVREQMRFAKDVGIRQDFKVTSRNFNVETHPERTPIIINNFNRLEYLKRVVSAVRARGYDNVYVIDNASSYEPLLEYYESEGLRVFYLDKNVGYLALWRTSIGENFTHNHYAYTDPDIEPSDGCPADFISHFASHLKANPTLSKVGFGLELDDLPQRYVLRNEVRDHEAQFWKQPLGNGLYFAAIDTTFALYRPRVVGGWWLDAGRTSGKYLARHLPWYADSANPTEEERYYQSTSTASTHWTRLEIDKAT